MNIININMNFICKTVTIVESNIIFDADVSHALPWAKQRPKYVLFFIKETGALKM